MQQKHSRFSLIKPKRLITSIKKYVVMSIGVAGLIFSPLSLTQENTRSIVNTKLQKVFGEQGFVVTQHDEKLLEISVGGEFYYATPDARYIFAGTVFNTDSMQNISVLRKNRYRKEHLDSQAKDRFISYPSNNEKHVVTIFTDIGCPYCRKMHEYMDEFNALGITINYVMVPGGGKGSANYQKTMLAMCSKDPAEAINQAMANKALSEQSCTEEGLFVKQEALIDALKITNTPSIVLPNGELRLGLTSPAQLMSFIEQQ
ncbi:DsbC family protein [Glaciecola sp. SC05]|uniref:DsbC family protein n=1 Tax=Glaciecola sp. SC05 TaxID=1987355 RepID=UPI003528D001